MMFWYGPAISTWAMTLMSIGSLLVLAALVAGAIALVRYARTGKRDDNPPPVTSSPESELATRFAYGEISAEQYQKALNALRAAATRAEHDQEKTTS